MNESLHMEGFPHQEATNNNKFEKKKAFGEASFIIGAWGSEFKNFVENNERFSDTSVVMTEYAQFIIERSNSLLEGTRIDGDYRAEQAVAKLHEFNLVHADLLTRSAEVFNYHPNTIPTLAKTYPWILDMQSWAETFIQGGRVVREEVQNGVSEKEKAFGEASFIIGAWGKEFKDRCLENGERFADVSVVMYEFSQFILERSSSLLEGARIDGDYRTEEAVAKLHEFNLVHADLLKRSAEVFLHYPDTVGTLAETYPWILAVQSWAETFIDGGDTMKSE